MQAKQSGTDDRVSKLKQYQLSFVEYWIYSSKQPCRISLSWVAMPTDWLAGCHNYLYHSTTLAYPGCSIQGRHWLWSHHFNGTRAVRWQTWWTKTHQVSLSFETFQDFFSRWVLSVAIPVHFALAIISRAQTHHRYNWCKLYFESFTHLLVGLRLEKRG